MLSPLNVNSAPYIDPHEEERKEILKRTQSQLSSITILENKSETESNISYSDLLRNIEDTNFHCEYHGGYFKLYHIKGFKRNNDKCKSPEKCYIEFITYLYYLDIAIRAINNFEKSFENSVKYILRKISFDQGIPCFNCLAYGFGKNEKLGDGKGKCANHSSDNIRWDLEPL